MKTRQAWVMAAYYGTITAVSSACLWRVYWVCASEGCTVDAWHGLALLALAVCAIPAVVTVVLVCKAKGA